MNSHVKETQVVMFPAAANVVLKRLTLPIDEIEEDNTHAADEVKESATRGIASRICNSSRDWLI
jgi:hypothetical protein